MLKSLSVRLLLLILPWGSLAWADDGSIQASMSSSVVSLDQTATLDVTIQGAGDVSEPQLPPLPQFSVEAAGTSRETTIVNGFVSNRLTIHYLLAPKQVGSYTLGPITAQVDGKTLATEPLKLEVNKGGNNSALVARPAAPANLRVPSPWQPAAPAAATPGSPAFAIAEVDNPTPYAGQCIHYRLKFYHSSGVSLLGQVQLPTTTGFIAHEAAPDKVSTCQIEGRTYQLNEIDIPLLATSAGRFEIGASRLPCRIPLALPGLGDDDFSMLLRGAEPQTLTTKPVQVVVRATPTEGRPDNFTGAVGELSMDARLDSQSATVGKPLELKVTVRALGDLELVQPPPLAGMSAFQVADLPVDSTPASIDEKGMTTRTFTFSLVPTRAGKQEVPAVSMAYFDPNTGQYKTVQTDPIPVQIEPGTEFGPSQPVAVEQPPGLRPQHLDLTLSKSTPLVESGVFWALQMVPLVGLGLAWLLGKRSLGKRSARGGGAWQQALSQLRRHPRPEQLSPLVYQYLCQKLALPVSAFSSPERRETLLRRGASAAQIDRLTDLLGRAEQARYAPHPDSSSDLSGQIRELLQDLERSLR